MHRIVSGRLWKPSGLKQWEIRIRRKRSTDTRQSHTSFLLFILCSFLPQRKWFTATSIKLSYLPCVAFWICVSLWLLTSKTFGETLARFVTRSVGFLCWWLLIHPCPSDVVWRRKSVWGRLCCYSSKMAPPTATALRILEVVEATDGGLFHPD